MTTIEETPPMTTPRDAGATDPDLDAHGPRLVARARRQRRLETLVSISSPPVLLVLWELLARAEVIDTRFFSRPSDIAQQLVTLIGDGTIPDAFADSMSRLVVGFVGGALPALLLGLVAGQSRLLAAALNPIVASLYPIPKIAVLPLIILVFGLGEMSKYVTIGIGVFFIVFINTVAGSRNVPALYGEVAQNFGAGHVTRFRTAILPAAMPTIVAGLKVAWGTAMLLMVASEFVGAQSGLGYLVWDSWQTFSITTMYAALVVIAAIGFVTLLLVDELEKRLMPWASRG